MAQSRIAGTAFVHEKARLGRVVSSLPQDATNVRPEARPTREWPNLSHGSIAAVG